MSKEAALRAMREARYAARQAGTSRQGQAAVRPIQDRSAVPVAPPAASDPAGDGLCGHRSMNGRTCTREHGHAAKSHRYS